MITYPILVATVDGRDLDDLARAAGLRLAELEALLAGGRAASPATKERLARALAANPLDLFRLEAHLEEALAAAPSRYITDPATLRKIDGR